MLNNNKSTIALVKILKLEKKLGFTDTAVIGGIDSFLNLNMKDLNFVPNISQVKYTHLGFSERKIWVDQILELISKKSNKNPISINSPANKLKGFPKGKFFEKISKTFLINTIEDLIYNFPDRHDDFSDLQNVNDLQIGMIQTVKVRVLNISIQGRGKGKQRVQIRAIDSQNDRINFTLFNQPWAVRNINSGSILLVSGEVINFKGQITIKSPQYEVVQEGVSNIHTGRMVPIYSLTSGVAQKTMRRAVRLALVECSDQISEFIPQEILNRTDLISKKDAIRKFHYPKNTKEFVSARRRLCFDELLLMQLVSEQRRKSWKSDIKSIPLNSDKLTVFLDSLPFSLTEAQKKVISEINLDITQLEPMSRLIQGDVGSGKTVVAAAAMLVAVINGKQAAMMAPTEVLAEQHFITLTRLFDTDHEGDFEEGSNILTLKIPGISRKVKIALLIGSLKLADKKKTQTMLSNSEVDIIVGTHALIQSTIEIPELALAVVDEQHRFGIIQRTELQNKNPRPHFLVMSATPIPKSLQATMLGDLDLSIIDEMPKGRKIIETIIETPDRRENVYEFIRNEIVDGRQAFIVFPLIDESESVSARAAAKEYERLSKHVFPDFNLGLIHGRMKLSEKETVMEEFRNNKINILIATAVIEVGVDVPNATVMFIDGAHRFGLAQMHQFRGRVGRGKYQSYCILMSDSPAQDSSERMDILKRINDGFKVAEEYLRIRGPGDYLGTRQSGRPIFKIANMGDVDILDLARIEARKLLKEDPYLEKPHNESIKNWYDQELKDLPTQVN